MLAHTWRKPPKIFGLGGSRVGDDDDDGGDGDGDGDGDDDDDDDDGDDDDVTSNAQVAKLCDAR